MGKFNFGEVVEVGDDAVEFGAEVALAIASVTPLVWLPSPTSAAR